MCFCVEFFNTFLLKLSKINLKSIPTAAGGPPIIVKLVEGGGGGGGGGGWN